MFDVLISKYLDGILTPEEDKELRAILSENPLAKEQFNLAVSLHIAMTDAEEGPQLDNIVFQTETQLFEKLNINTPKRVTVPSTLIVTESSFQPNHTDKPIRKQRRILKASRLPLVVSLFLLFVNVVSDSLFTDGTNHFSDDLNIVDKPLLNNKVVSSDLEKEKVSVTFVSSVQNEENEYTVATLDTHDINTVVSNSEEFGVAHNNNNKVLSSVSSDIPHFLPFSTAISTFNNSVIGSVTSIVNIPSTPPINTQTPDLGKETIVTTMADVNVQNGISSDIPTIKNTDVPHSIALTDITTGDNSPQKGEGKLHIGSFVNNGFVYADNSKATASSFSQSIGYGISSSTKIGLEMGRVGYSFTQQSSGTGVPGSLAGINRTNIVAHYSKNSSLIMGKEDNNGNNDVSKINQPVNSSSLNQDIAVVWGGAFIEQMVVNTSDFDINVRGGVGVAGDGAVLFARTYAEYKLSSFMSVTFGGEGKNFTIRNASRSEKSLSTNYMIGLVYGLQIKF